MSTYDPNGSPQHPQQQPPYGQPQYGQPYPQAPYVQPSQQGLPPQQQFAQPVQQHGLPPYPYRPAAQRNSLALTAFILAVIGALVVSLVSPLIMQAIYRTMASSYNAFSIFMFDWGPLVISLPVLALALILGFVAAQPKRPASGKVLAYVAIGAAGFGIITVVLTLISAIFIRGLYF